MPDKSDVYSKLQEIITGAMLELQEVAGEAHKAEFVNGMKLLMEGIMSTTADLAEVNVEGSGIYLYSEIEASAKKGGIRHIRDTQGKSGNTYSISDIDDNDVTTAMNYVGQELSTTLFKTIHELPKSLRGLEMFLRPIEVLLANLLNSKFRDVNPHQVMDNLSEHVHMMLNDLEARNTNKPDSLVH